MLVKHALVSENTVTRVLFVVEELLERLEAMGRRRWYFLQQPADLIARRQHLQSTTYSIYIFINKHATFTRVY